LWIVPEQSYAANMRAGILRGAAAARGAVSLTACGVAVRLTVR
jgi:hypothetical protein